MAAHPACKLDSLGRLAFHNAPPPPNASDPSAGARWQYDRRPAHQALGGSRWTPFDLEIDVLDSGGASITSRPDVAAYLCRLVATIWLWDSTAWRTQLQRLGLPEQNVTGLLQTKGAFFWEMQSQFAAERVLAAQHEVGASAPLWTYGPECVDAALKLNASCEDGGVADAHTVHISTWIDGRRDPLGMISRNITCTCSRGEWPLSQSTAVSLSIEFPAGARMATPTHELLDWRPLLGGARMRRVIHVRTTNPPHARERYPDFNRLSVPLRHLLFQARRMPAPILATRQSTLLAAHLAHARPLLHQSPSLPPRPPFPFFASSAGCGE